MKKYRFEIIIFTVEAICMILELLASRILSPYFGSSNIVWTSVIGIILLSGSLGNFIGGIIADKKNIEKNLKIILVLTTLFIILIPVIQNYVIQFVLSVTKSSKIGAILCTILLFFIPSFLMGLFSPIIMKLKLNNLESTGRVSGKVNGIATLGGIIGTFVGGFILIPIFGTMNILFILTILIVLLIPLINFKIKEISNIFVIIILIISFISMYFYTSFNNIIGEQILKDEFVGSVSYDTQYGRVLIFNGKINNRNVRALTMDGGYESATYTDKEYRYELCIEYTKKYDLMFETNKEIDNVLMIGGGGYSYPKYYISHFEDKVMDVVEIDEEITKLAKKYFFLDELIEDYNLEENQRLNLITDDGRVYLNNNSKKYDAILNDAFSGSIPVKTLTTIEAIENIKNSLTNDGLYLTNIISSLDGENSKFLKAEVNTLRQVFKNVYVISEIEEYESVNNIMVIATDNNVDFENTKEIELKEDEIILTDDYCPIDSLIAES